MFEEKYFARRKVDFGKLIDYGFTEGPKGYEYATAVMDGQLKLTVWIAHDGAVSTQMTDTATNEEYFLYKVTSSVGAYVGEVRTECEKILADISQKCWEPDVFQGQQSAAVIEYVRERFGDELEFLWEKFADNAIWRRKDNQKWYGLIVTISKSKLGLDSDELVDAIILRLRPDRMADLIDHEKYFPGWHMNKKSWYTIMLDGSVPLHEIYRRIDESYDLAVK